MKQNKLLLGLMAMALSMSACKKFEAFQTDPNKPTQAAPNLLLTSIEANAFNEVSLSATLASRQMAYTDGVNDNQYYGWQRSGFGNYGNLRQVNRMELEANRMNKPSYVAIAKFFRVYYIMRLTMVFGDVPYSEALQATEGNYTPKYDAQEDIFIRALDELKEANAALTAASEAVEGDILYAGKITQWKKLINSYSLRILMTLSNKTNNTKLNVKQRFAEIVNNPAQYPIFDVLADQAQLKFVDKVGNRYPFYNDNSIQTAYYMDESFVNMLKTLKDPRLFSFAAKAPKFDALPATDFNAYGGLQGSASINLNSDRAAKGEASKINRRFYADPANEPGIAIGYAELQFILAEAVVRGWITGSADAYYKKGITASFQFYNINTDAADTYKAQAAVQLTAGTEIKSIITQKYIASFMHLGWNSFYEQRRTGFPTFEVVGDGVLNNKKIPVRWMYPENEGIYNADHLKEAINRQFTTGGDNVNGVMWLLKAE
ncbi:SusD-like starch-binding protein associating with outer membrane [Chitinophaga skermanii]|uniref:SusD-like starch-binding protein associating with outer membrane n=1 Tax=Chitinophaga skermanii TaxID=331697 RepID=A0A327QJ79_9BACT|nr:SusD/RagB family nutrient-binding outer membrane lipoprotein [Chitinophaga skermanii]RAJ04038.1 SusD-like starch-binding protein associating with outer membrane [Chitinophaga skermanii]